MHAFEVAYMEFSDLGVSAFEFAFLLGSFFVLHPPGPG